MFADPFKIEKALTHLSPEKTQLVLDFTSKAIESAKNGKVPSNLWEMMEDLHISKEVQSVIDSYTIETQEEFELTLTKYKQEAKC